MARIADSPEARHVLHLQLKTVGRSSIHVTGTGEPRGGLVGYQPALDGLRAVAVAAVLVYHGQATLDGLGHGGYLGVDVFFVLSGFLITALLLGEHRSTGRIALRRFWARRARRLVPGLLLMLAFATVVTKLLHPNDVAKLHDDIVYSLLYVQNWHFVFGPGVFQSTLYHTWSLSVEEQWYLGWPVVLTSFLVLTAKTRTLLAVVLGLALMSTLWVNFLYTHGRPSHAVFGTDARAQELLIGAALAVFASGASLVLKGRARHLVDGAGILLLVGIIAAFLSVSANEPALYRGGSLLLSCATVLVIAACVQPKGATRTVLAFGPLPAIGRLSYGLYLFHIPVYAWLDGSTTGLAGLPLLGIRILATGVVASLSFFIVERPLRQGRCNGYALLGVGASVAVTLVLATS